MAHNKCEINLFQKYTVFIALETISLIIESVLKVKDIINARIIRYMKRLDLSYTKCYPFLLSTLST